MPVAVKKTKDATDDFISPDEKKKMKVNEAKQKAELSPLWSRSLAYGIDWAMYTGAMFVPYFIAMAMGRDAGAELEGEIPPWKNPLVYAMLAASLVPCSLNAFLISLRGQTVGKLIFGLVIVDDASMKPVGFHQGVLTRWIGWNLKKMVPILGARLQRDDISALLFNETITEHDMFANTLVIRTRSL